MKKFRILPKGFALIIVVLLISILGAATWIRSNSPSNSLYYALNQTENDHITGKFKILTIGDAVNYTYKDISTTFDLMLYKGSFQITNQSNETNAYLLGQETYTYNGQEKIYPEIKSNVFLKDSLQNLSHELMTQNTTLDSILEEYKHQLFKVYKQYMTFNKKNVVVTMSLEALYNNLEKNRQLLFKDDHLVDYFNQYVAPEVLKNFTGDYISSKLLIQYKEVLLNQYSSASIVTCECILDNEQIIALNINISLEYLDCDAKENIQLKIVF